MNKRSIIEARCFVGEKIPLAFSKTIDGSEESQSES
jgi:hypothetical protein